jgi:hypothetical protein
MHLQSLHHLTSLTLRDCALPIREPFPILRLHHLEVIGDKIRHSASDLRFLVNPDYLESLKLYDVAISYPFRSQVMPHLRVLHIIHCEIDFDLSFLVGYPQLMNLSIVPKPSSRLSFEKQPLILPKLKSYEGYLHHATIFSRSAHVLQLSLYSIKEADLLPQHIHELATLSPRLQSLRVAALYLNYPLLLALTTFPALLELQVCYHRNRPRRPTEGAIQSVEVRFHLLFTNRSREMILL